jgi:hypothetical protein
MEINAEKGNVMLNRTGFSSIALTRKTAKSFFIAPAPIPICISISVLTCIALSSLLLLLLLSLPKALVSRPQAWVNFTKRRGSSTQSLGEFNQIRVILPNVWVAVPQALVSFTKRWGSRTQAWVKFTKRWVDRTQTLALLPLKKSVNGVNHRGRVVAETYEDRGPIFPLMDAATLK